MTKKSFYMYTGHTKHPRDILQVHQSEITWAIHQTSWLVKCFPLNQSDLQLTNGKGGIRANNFPVL
jgi:hypothetical protein